MNDDYPGGLMLNEQKLHQNFMNTTLNANVYVKYLVLNGNSTEKLADEMYAYFFPRSFQIAVQRDISSDMVASSTRRTINKR